VTASRSTAVIRTEALAVLRALVGILSSSARAVERRTGVTNAQLFLLQQIAASGPCSLGELAELAHTQPSTVSVVIGRLQRAGLVTRVRAVDDRRRAVIALTGSGNRLLRRAPKAPTARLLEAMRALDDRDARHLVHGLKPLLAALGASHSAPPMMFEASTPPAGRRRAKANYLL
jgi:DNA-binding MarR family transcriptional regulator